MEEEKRPQSEALDQLALQALRAKTDDAYFSQFAEENKRLIMGAAYRTVNHFIIESDEEWSVSLLAFHEAVRSYDAGKGNFSSFASMVIRRRLTDYLRSVSAKSQEVLVPGEVFDGSYEDEDSESGDASQNQVAGELRSGGKLSATSWPGKYTIRDEIEAVQDIFKEYGFSFYDLTECSPKAEKTKEACRAVLQVLAGSPDLLKKMRQTKSVPAAELMAETGVKQKILERHRRYLIAVAEILDGDYPLLQEYVREMRPERAKRAGLSDSNDSKKTASGGRVGRWMSKIRGVILFL